MTKGWQLRAYLALRPALQPLMRLALRRRVRAGKDDPARVGEKLGLATRPRPAGRVVWMHAVGLGEAMALRPLILAMQAQAPDLSFVITSTARSSAQVLGQNLPPRCVHQFLPLDGPAFLRSFLDHWRPDLSVWSEQDLWPGAIHDCAARGIPLAYVNARMNDASHRRRARLEGLYRDTLARFAIIAAQDATTAQNLHRLGAGAVTVTGSLKPAAEPLAADPAALADLAATLRGRRIWVAASTHAADEAVVMAAQSALAVEDPNWLLILAPRVPDRRAEVAVALQTAGLSHALRSAGQRPATADAVWLADSFGELGLWYRLAGAAYVGASFGGVGGHNPWEAICLSCPVLHGPDVANFAADYAALDAMGLAHQVTDRAEGADSLAAHLRRVGAEDTARMQAVIDAARQALAPLASDLVALIRARP
ncbi:MAG: glycosyltransferase N-terminal domain-containing protein [Paracoccaceae bacterium]